jgi:hypothetical protein
MSETKRLYGLSDRQDQILQGTKEAIENQWYPYNRFTENEARMRLAADPYGAIMQPRFAEQNSIDHLTSLASVQPEILKAANRMTDERVSEALNSRAELIRQAALEGRYPDNFYHALNITPLVVDTEKSMPHQRVLDWLKGR